MEMNVFTYTTAALFTFVVLFQFSYIIVTFRYSRKPKALKQIHPEDTISILIPAYNEAAVIESCLKGVLALNYTNYETIFINDGSDDYTLERLIDLLDAERTVINPSGSLIYAKVHEVYRSKKYPNIYIIDKENGGKANSLNAGIAYATGNIMITLDADSILQHDSLIYVNQEFNNPDVIAAGGMVQVGQMYNKAGKPVFKGNPILKYQLSDYLMSFYVRRFAQSKMKMIAIVSGAFGVFRRDVLHDIGGYKKTLGEDMEITLNIQTYIRVKRKQAKLIFIPEAVCFTEVPENLRDVYKQRIRWQKGFVDCIVKYRKSFFRTLSVGFTLFLFWDAIIMAVLGILTIILLPILIIADLFTIYHLILMGVSVVLQFVFRVTTYWSATRYSHNYRWFEYVRLILFFIIELPFRPLLDMSFYLFGTFSYVFEKDKHNWNKVKRLGNVEITKKSA